LLKSNVSPCLHSIIKQSVKQHESIVELHNVTTQSFAVTDKPRNTQYFTHKEPTKVGKCHALNVKIVSLHLY